PASGGRGEEVRELILALAEKLEMERLVRFERRVDEIAERAAGLEHRAVPRVLRQERPVTLAPRLQADAGPPRIGIQPHFHVRPLSSQNSRRAPNRTVRGG